MTYESPKQIRRRRQRAEDRPARRQSIRIVGIPTDSEWGNACDAHMACLLEKIEQGHSDAAGRHARHLVHAAVWRRASQVMVDLGLRSYRKATEMARHELLNCEI